MHDGRPVRGGHRGFGCWLYLKADAQTELHVALAALGRNLAERAVGRIAIESADRRTPRTAPIRVVNKVVPIGAELDVYPFLDSEVFKERQIPVLEARSVHDVAQPILHECAG